MNSFYFHIKSTLFFLLLSFSMFGASISELEASLAKAKKDSDKMQIHYQLAELYKDGKKYSKASENAASAYKLAIKTDNDAMRSRAALLDGQVLLKLNKKERAEGVLKTALKYGKLADKQTLIYESLITLAEYYEKEDALSKAVVYKNAAIKLLEKEKVIFQEAPVSTPSKSKAETNTNPQLTKYLAQMRELELEKQNLLIELGKLRKQLKGDGDSSKPLTKQEKEELLKELENKKLENESVQKKLASQSKTIKKLNRKALENRALENQLRADLAEADLESSKYENFRNMAMASGGFILLVVYFLWSRMRSNSKKKRALEQKNTEIESQKQRSDELLLNILPQDIAQELKDKGNVKARKFEQATVLFSDFKNFSKISTDFTPEQLVKELDHCFKAFDYIITQYQGIEKIKTIGDAYMCVSGLSAKRSIPTNIVKAALDIQRFMEEYKEDRKSKGMPYFEARIGMHTGSVVAGVVGFKKFVYDIWGPTVNTAARMESNSAAGCVNISNDTYRLIGHKFECKYRGKIEAKNIGLVDSYFVIAEK